MQLIKTFKNRKILLLNIFLVLYVFINLIGGERGLISYFEKKNTEIQLTKKVKIFSLKLNDIENKNNLLSKKNDLDYLDKLYREKLMLGTKNEVLIKLR
jgi:cell division protein DivIC|tara:strand:+ start:6889 stop:7185 length:297 start_codon:yes stop_codon:yes gene_type:complete